MEQADEASHHFRAMRKVIPIIYFWLILLVLEKWGKISPLFIFRHHCWFWSVLYRTCSKYLSLLYKKIVFFFLPQIEWDPPLALFYFCFYEFVLVVCDLCIFFHFSLFCYLYFVLLTFFLFLKMIFLGEKPKIPWYFPPHLGEVMGSSPLFILDCLFMKPCPFHNLDSLSLKICPKYFSLPFNSCPSRQSLTTPMAFWATFH